MPRLALHKQAPLVLGAAAIVGLALAVVVPAILQAGTPWPKFAPFASGCLANAHTIVHSDNREIGRGHFQPCLIDTGLTSGEPGLAISRDGTLLRSVTLKPTGIAVSSDGGQHWQRRPLPAGARDGIPDGYIDPVTDRYFYSGLGDSPVYASDDQGRTWQTGSFDSGQRYDWNRVFSGRPVRPHPSGYPTNIYYCNMTQPGGFTTGSRCFRSIDGGRHFVTSGRDPYAPGDCRDQTQPRGSGMGRGVVDPRDGSIYLTVYFCGALEVVISRDEGATWSRQVVVRQPGSSGGTAILAALASPAWRHQLMNGRANIVPAEMAANQSSDGIAIDGAGRLYVVWIGDDFRPMLSWSADRGQTWHAPVQIGAPGIAQAVLPSLAVTADGKVGVSYYGTTDKQAWTGYMAIGANAAGPQPVFETAAITPPGTPLMPEPCCWASGPQEYTAARWAPDGTLWAAFVATTAKGPARGVMGHLVPRPPHTGQ